MSTGKLQQYPVGITPTELELATPVIKSTLGTGVPLPTPIDITPDTTLSQYAQFEKYSGMLAKVAGTTVVGPTSSGAFYAAQSSRPRPFREPGVDATLTLPDGAGANVPRYDGNPEVLRVDMSGCTNPAALANGDISGDLVGPLGYYYSATYGSGSYSLFSCLTGTTTRRAVPLSDRANDQFTVASFNMLNFAGATTQTAKAVLEIRDILKMPDVIGVEEVADEASLQKVADGLNATVPSPNYLVKMGVISDKQNVGFLYRSDRVTNPVFTVLGNADKMTDTCANYTVWDRQPFEMDATLKTHQGRDFPVTIVVNHLKSLIDVDANTNAGKCVRWKRQIEAEQLAQILASLQQSGKNVITVGDFNAFDFNDGYVDVMGTIIGAPAPADQVTLATTDYVDPNLTDLVASWPDRQIYTYVENGSAQSIDHIIANDALLARPYHVEVGHVNADFPTSFSSDASRPERVSDHDQPVAYFTFPTYVEAAALTSPTQGTLLSGKSAEFSWTTGGLVDHYRLYLGTTVGATDIYFSGDVTSTSANVTGLRTVDGNIYVRLYSWIPSINNWRYNDYVFAYNAPKAATLTAPALGTALSGKTATFTWTPGNLVSTYMLYVGTQPGVPDDYYSGPTTSTSIDVYGLRTVDGNIYVRLYSWVTDHWLWNDYVFAYNAPKAATLTAPALGTALSGKTASFTWTPGTLVTKYMLYVGTQPGVPDDYYSGPTTSTSIDVYGLRTVDGNIYVRLYSWFENTWHYNDYVFAYTRPQAATLTAPAPGTTLTGKTATFTWTPGTLVTKYMLYVGTQPGVPDDYYSGAVTTTSLNMYGLRSTDGNIYVRLYSWIDNTWQYNDYVFAYTPPVQPVAATLTAPSVISGRTATFTWTAGTGIDHYMLYVGTQPGVPDDYYSGATTSRSIDVTGIRSTDGNVYVRLYSWATDHWLWKDYVFPVQ